MVQFEIIGTLKAVKDSDKFKSLEVLDFPSGWQTTRYRFNVVSDTNRFMCEISGGKWKDDSKNKILTFSRPTEGKKSEKIEIAWNDRRNPEKIDQVAGYKIYTCNLLTYDERKALEDDGKKEEADKKNYQFLEQTEYALLIKKLIDSGKYADAKFKILGTMDFSYNSKNGQYYRNYTVNKIYKVSDETPCKAEMTVNAYYTEDAVDSELYDEKKKYMFNCYTDYYFSSIKENRFVPMALVINGNGDETAAKRAEGFKKKLTAFDDEATVRKIGLVCDLIDGAEAKAITYDDLDDETKENVDFGLVSLEEAIRALGGNVMGQRITEYRIKSLARNSVKGSETTVYTVDDLKALPVPKEESVTEEVVDDDDFDLFADDDF